MRIAHSILRTGFFWIAFHLLSVLSAGAQQYPVQGTLAILSPYPANLGDYANPNIEKLVLNLTLTDINISNKRVRLKLFIQKQNSVIAQGTDNTIGEPTIVLDGGVPQRLTSIELANYFKVENLQGLSGDAYGQPLPEGVYNIGFEVYDYFTGNKLSGRIGQMFWLMLNDPPLLNMPLNRENIVDANPNNPQIIFQWTPRSTQVTNTEYEFTLAELWDDQGDPDQQFLAAIPKYQTTTNGTTLLYGITEPPLLAGRSYAWRVKATAKAGFEDIGLYRQNGYSEIRVFRYGGQCAAVTNVNMEVKGYDRMYITWQPPIGSPLTLANYKIAYRKYTPSNDWEWQEVGTANTFYNLFDLEAYTEYEVKVGNSCDNNLVSYSQPQIIRTLQNGQVAGINCGQAPTIDIGNKNPIDKLVAGDVVMAGDFPITLTKVEGGSGSFSGEGWVKVPWLADTKIKVKFTGIRVNTDRKLLDGYFETTYDASGKNIADVDKTIDALVAIINDVTDLFKTDANGNSGLQSVANQIKNIDIDDKDQADASKDAQLAITNTVQPPVGDVAQTALNNMDSAKHRYDAAKQALDSATTDDQKQAAQQKIDSAKSSYVASQQQLAGALQSAAEILKYRFPTKEWFTAIDSFLLKYTGGTADKTLSQYYWHKQTDSAYNLVTTTYQLPDSLQQKLDAAYSASTMGWTGLQQGIALFHPLRHSHGGYAGFHGFRFNVDNVDSVDQLRQELENDVEWSKTTSADVPVNLKCFDGLDVGKVFVDPAGGTITLDGTEEPFAFFSEEETERYGRLAAIKKDGQVYIYYNLNGSYSGRWGKIDLGSTSDDNQLIRMSSNGSAPVLVKMLNGTFTFNGTRYTTGNCGFTVTEVKKGEPLTPPKIKHVTDPKGDSNSNATFIAQLSSRKSGSGVKSQDLPVKGATQVYDYAGRLNSAEVQKLLADLRKTNGYTGVAGKIFITDSNTPIGQTTATQTYMANLQGTEMALWIHFKSDGTYEVKINIGNGIAGYNDPSTQTFINKIIENLGLVNDPNFNPLTAILDGLAGMIGKLEISDRFYNPDATDYNSLPAQVYGFTNGGVLEQAAKDVIMGSSAYTDKYSVPRCDFAFVCGVWNGLVGLTSSIPTGASMVIKVIINENNIRDSLLAKMGRFKWAEMKKMATDGFAKYTANPCMVNYSGGQAGFFVASCFIGAGEFGAASDALKVMGKLDVVSHIMTPVFKGIGWVIRPVTRAIGRGGEFVFKVARAFVEPGLTIEGKLYSSLIPIPPIKLTANIKSAFEKAKTLLNTNKAQFENSVTLLKDDAGKLIKDADGNVLGEIEVTLEDGSKEKAQILLNEDEAKLKNAADEVDDGSKTILLSFADQIDKTIARLNGKAKFVLEGTGEYGSVGGHHPLAKSAFKDNFSSDVDFKKYYDEAFSVSVQQLEKFGGKGIHAKITGQQNSLYTAWKNANSNVKMSIDDMVNIEIQVMVTKGIPQDVATGWVVKALQKLKTQRVTNISNIPWNGVN